MTKIYIVNGTSLTIGRGTFCTLSIPDNEMLNDIHVSVECKNNRIMLMMNGKNGGYVKNRFICCGEKILIKNFDEVRLPLITFMYINNMIIISSEKEIVTKCLEYVWEENDENNTGKAEIGLNSETEELSNANEDNQIPAFFSSVPRTNVTKDVSSVEIEAPPEKREETIQNKIMTVGPALTMVIPMFLGVFISLISSKSGSMMSGAFMYTGLITAVCSAIFGVMWSMLNLKDRKQQLEILERRRQKLYRQYIADKEELIKSKYITCKNNLIKKNPVIHDYFDDSNVKYMLWNVGQEEDLLELRLGIGRDKFSVQIDTPKYRLSLVEDGLKKLPLRLKQKYEYIEDVPICINLTEKKIIGVVADNEIKLECIINNMILMCACRTKPENLQIGIMLTKDEKLSLRLSYIRFLPHVQSEYGSLIAFRKEKSRKIQRTICDLLNENSSFVIFTDDYNQLYDEIKENSSVHIVVFSNSFEKLSGECRCIVNYSDNFSGIINLESNETSRQEILFDEINIHQAEAYTRKLQGLYSGRKESVQIPSKVSFFNIWNISYVSAEEVLKNWNINNTLRDIRIPIGIGMDGITYLDLDEKNMGPHGLVAGMTGSGKSEILQTIILSIIYKYSPYEAGIFLIDYKGGGMSKLFEDIPHVFGSISNLSGRIINRAMISIRGECLRRQRIFLQCSVNKIAEYQEKYYKGEADAALPHIFIVIDEFAELKKEEPEFMKELISVARVGRSLGIHLILATQKPAGCVDDDIWSNSRFRIALRVQDKQDSNEVLHKPDAAFIKNVGRAYLQVGNDEIYKCFQGAYTGTKVSANTMQKQEVYLIDEDGLSIEDSFYDVSSEDAQPELQVICNTVKEAYKKYIPLNNKSYIENRLWLNPLPENLILPNCITYKSHQNNTTTITIGKYDDPANQKQDYVNIDVLNDGNIAILGESKSGKTTLIQTILYQFCKSEREDINLYIADFSLSMLKPFKNMAMCGGYISESNLEAIKRLFILLNDEIAIRKKLLQGGNYSQYKKNNELPLIVVVIDGLSYFRENLTDDDEMVFLNLVKQSVTYGIHFYITANEISAQEMPQRLFEKMNKVVALSLKDKYSYKEALKITGSDFVTPEDICGRGLVKEGDAVLEMQIFEPVMASNDYERIEVLNEAVKSMRHVVCKSLKVIPEIPDNMTVKQLVYDYINVRQAAMEATDVCEIPIGYEAESGKVCSITLFEGIVLITGKADSEKNNFFKMVIKILNYMKGEIEFLNTSVCENITEKIIDESISISCNGKILKFIVFDNMLNFDLMDEVSNTPKEKLCVINMGGEVDRCPYGDFSYIPYSKQSRVLKKGHGLISKNEYTTFGEIIVPIFDKEVLE